jgi:hypothetical protein
VALPICHHPHCSYSVTIGTSKTSRTHARARRCNVCGAHCLCLCLQYMRLAGFLHMCGPHPARTPEAQLQCAHRDVEVPMCGVHDASTGEHGAVCAGMYLRTLAAGLVGSIP